MNVAEIEISILSRQCLARRIADEHTLREETEIWVNERNAEPVKIDWQFTAADARVKLKHLYPERKNS